MRRYRIHFLFACLMLSLISPVTSSASGRNTDHVWSEWMVSIPPTCTEPGLEYRECVKLPDYPHYEEREIPALGHDYGPWVVVREATAEQTGLREMVCRHDSAHVIQEIIPQLPAAATAESETESSSVPETETETEAQTEPLPPAPAPPPSDSGINPLDIILSAIAVSSAGIFVRTILWDCRIIRWSNRMKSQIRKKGGI